MRKASRAGPVSRPYPEGVSERLRRLREWGRDAALWFGRRQGRLPLAQLGELAGGMDYAAVSVAVRRFGQRFAGDRNLRGQVDEIQRMLLNVESGDVTVMTIMTIMTLMTIMTIMNITAFPAVFSSSTGNADSPVNLGGSFGSIVLVPQAAYIPELSTASLAFFGLAATMLCRRKSRCLTNG